MKNNSHAFVTTILGFMALLSFVLSVLVFLGQVEVRRPISDENVAIGLILASLAILKISDIICAGIDRVEGDQND